MKKQLLTLVAVCVVLMALLAFVLFGLLTSSFGESLEEGTIQSYDEIVEESFDLESYLADIDAENEHIAIQWDDDYWYMETDSLPDHETGDFPNEGNPNTITAIETAYRISRDPRLNADLTEVKIFGITLGGVSFDPGTAEKDEATGWSIEGIQDLLDLGLDANNAHVQPSGKYHYHGIPESLVDEDQLTEHSTLIGFAADGFPIYARYGYDEAGEVTTYASSWQLKSGERIDGPEGEYDGTYTLDFEYIDGSGDLDECNGIYAETPEYPNGTYAYFLTDTFPYVPRCVYGEPDETFLQQDEGALPQGAGAHGELPPPGTPSRP